MNEMDQIIEAVAVTAEVFGQQLSAAALATMAQDLAPYGLHAVLAALARTRREQSRLSLAAVLSCLNTADGRPEADEAWAGAQCAFDEAETVVWVQEAAQAFEIARPLLEINDKTGARMAFRDAYERLCRQAREAGEQVRWIASLGWDADRRTAVLTAAVEAGKLDAHYARGLLPPPPATKQMAGAVLQLVASQGVLTDQAASALQREAARKRIAGIKAMLVEKKP